MADLKAEMIKTIIFDMGRVLIPFDFQRGYEKLAPMGKYSAAEIPEQLRSHDLVQRFESGQVSSREFVEEISGILELKCEYQDFCDAWTSIFSTDVLIPEEMLLALKKRYRIQLLSNTNAIHWEMVRENYPALKHFDAYTLSFEVGAMKPDPKIYHDALSKTESKPDECFFTDDIQAYVDGAKAMGMEAAQFRDAKQLAEELRARGVSW